MVVEWNGGIDCVLIDRDKGLIEAAPAQKLEAVCTLKTDWKLEKLLQTGCVEVLVRFSLKIASFGLKVQNRVSCLLSNLAFLETSSICLCLDGEAMRMTRSWHGAQYYL